MKVLIERVKNGYILKYKDDKVVTTLVFDEDGKGAIPTFIDLVRTLESLIGEIDSRYSQERLFLGVLPGDKYEGENTDLVKETIEKVQYFAKGSNEN